ncbi:hypothetical protein ACFQZX_07450 [Mucilaginibacter litoreus]|uniref:Uncharacterized protein n=1 Tax=Mucilaginibacter litoreus TaxID=1048221 RepID=A0ABW3ARG8_9SPHI
MMIIAACLLVAKPFIGFSRCSRLLIKNEPLTILIKSFSKYRLDQLEDTEFCKDVSGELYPQPLLPLIIGIAGFFGLLYLNFKELKIQTQAFIKGSNRQIITTEPTYIALHRLII